MGNFFYGKEILEPEEYLQLQEEADRLKEIYATLDTLDEKSNVTDAVYDAVAKFESGDRSDRHNNDGAVLYTDYLNEKYGATQGDELLDDNGQPTGMFTAYFDDPQKGTDATKDIINFHLTNLQSEGQSPNKTTNNMTFGEQFAVRYTGSQDPEVIANYGAEIDKNIANIKKRDEYKTLVKHATGKKSDIVSKADLVHKFRHFNPMMNHLSDEDVYQRIQKLMPEEIERLNDPTWSQSANASWNKSTKNLRKSIPQLFKLIDEVGVGGVNLIFGAVKETAKLQAGLMAGKPPEDLRELGNIILGEKFDPNFDYRKAYLSGDKDPRLFDIMNAPGMTEKGGLLDVFHVVNLMSDENRDKVFSQIAYNEIIDERNKGAGIIGNLSPELTEDEKIKFDVYKNKLFKDFAGLNNIGESIDQWERDVRESTAKNWKKTIEENPDIQAALLWSEGEKLTEGDWSRAKITELAAGVLPSQGITKAFGAGSALLSVIFSKGKNLVSKSPKTFDQIAKSAGTSYVWGNTFGGFFMEGTAHYEEGMEYLTNDREITPQQYRNDLLELKENLKNDYFSESDTYFDYETGKTFTLESLFNHQVENNYKKVGNKFYEKGMDYRDAADMLALSSISHGAFAAIVENLESRIFTSVAMGRNYMTSHMLDKKGLTFFGNMIEKYNKWGRRVISTSKRKFSEGTLQKMGYNLSKLAIMGTTEGIEEIIQGMSGEAHAAWHWRREGYHRDWETVAQEFTGGFLGALMLGGGSTISQTVRGTQRISNLLEGFNAKYREGTFTKVEKDENGDFIIMQYNNYYDNDKNWVSEKTQMDHMDVRGGETAVGYILHPETGKKIPTKFNRYRDAYNTSKILNKAYQDMFRMLDVYDYRSVLDGSVNIEKIEEDGKEVYQVQILGKDGKIYHKTNFDKKSDAINAKHNSENYLETVYNWSLDYGGIDKIIKSNVVQHTIEQRKIMTGDIEAEQNQKDEEDIKKKANVSNNTVINTGKRVHSKTVLAVDSHMGVDTSKKYNNNQEADADLESLTKEGLNENPDILANELENNPEYWENSDFTPEEVLEKFDERYQDAPNYLEARERITKNIPQEIFDQTANEAPTDTGPEVSPEVGPDTETTPKIEDRTEEKEATEEEKQETLSILQGKTVEKEKKAIEVGEETTLYTSVGRPVKVKVTAKESEDSFKYEDPNSGKEVLYTGEALSKQDPKSENYKLETVKDSPKVSNMTTGQLNTLLKRKLKAAKETKGNKAQPDLYQLHEREAEAIQNELTRRRSKKKKTKVSDNPEDSNYYIQSEKSIVSRLSNPKLEKLIKEKENSKENIAKTDLKALNAEKARRKKAKEEKAKKAKAKPSLKRVSKLGVVRIDDYSDTALDNAEENVIIEVEKLKDKGEVSITKKGGHTAAWFGPVDYEYTGSKHKAKEMPPVIENLKNAVEDSLEKPRGYYDSVLINIYEPGIELAAHQDNEEILRLNDGSIGSVGTLSLGGTSIIEIKFNNKTVERHEVKDGHIYEFPAGNFQDTYYHGVGPSKTKRVSLTFRKTNFSEAPTQPLIIKHFTEKENINKILTEGFDTSLAPLFGLSEGGPIRKFGEGMDVLYFTTDENMWGNVFVGEGKGDVDIESTPITSKIRQGGRKIPSIEALIKDDAKILVIDSKEKWDDILEKDYIRRFGSYENYRKSDEYAKMEGIPLHNIIAEAKAQGYDILNVKYSEKWLRYEKTRAGLDDYFIFNKDAITILSEFSREKRKLVELPKPNDVENKEELIKSRLDKLFNTFNKKVKYQIVNKENAPKGREDEVAWITGNTVYVNSDIFDVTAPFHEFSHPFILDLKLENRGLFDSLVKNVKKNDPKLWEAIQEKYSDKSVLVQEEELLAHKLEDIARNQYEENDSNNSIVKALKKFWKWLKERLFGTSSNEDIYARNLNENTTLEDITSMIINNDGRYKIILSEQTLNTLEVGEDVLTENQEKYGLSVKKSFDYTAAFQKSFAEYDSELKRIQARIGDVPDFKNTTEFNILNAFYRTGWNYPGINGLQTNVSGVKDSEKSKLEIRALKEWIKTSGLKERRILPIILEHLTRAYRQQRDEKGFAPDVDTGKPNNDLAKQEYFIKAIRIEELKRLRRGVEEKLEEEGLRQHLEYEITVNDIEKFEKIPFERFKKEVKKEILEQTLPITEEQLMDQVLKRMEIEGLGVRTEAQIELEGIFESMYRNLKDFARKQEGKSAPRLVNPFDFATSMFESLPTWASKSFQNWWENKFDDDIRAFGEQVNDLLNKDNYVLNDEDIHNENINYINEIDFLNQDLAYKLATNEELATKNELALETTFMVVLTKKQIDDIYLSAKDFQSKPFDYLEKVFFVEMEDTPMNRRDAWIKHVLKNIIRKRYSTLTPYQQSDMIKTYNRIFSSVRTNSQIIDSPNKFDPRNIEGKIPVRNEKSNLEILMEPQWIETPEGWRKVFDLGSDIGKLMIRYKTDTNPSTGDTNVSREKTTLAKYFKVNQDTDVLWLSQDDMFMYEDKRYKDDKGKWRTVMEDGPDGQVPVKVFNKPFNALSESNIVSLAIGLKRLGYAIAFSKSDSGNIAIVKVTNNDLALGSTKKALEFWNEQIEKGYLTHDLNDDGSIKVDVATKVKNLMKGKEYDRAREIAVFRAVNDVYPGYLNDLKGGNNVYDRLKIPFTPVTISPTMPSIRVERFNPEEVLFRGVETDVVVNGERQRTFPSHSPVKSKGLPKSTYIGDGKTITSQATFDLFLEHHGLRKTTAKAKTVIYYKKKNKSIMVKHQHMLPRRNWEITDLQGNVLYRIDNDRNITDANGNDVHMLVTEDEMKVGAEVKGGKSTNNGLMTSNGNSMMIPGQAIGFIKFDEHSKENVKHAAQPYNHIYDQDVIDAWFDNYLPKLEKGLRQAFLLGSITEEQLAKDPNYQSKKILKFLKTFSGKDAPSFIPHAVELAKLGAGVHTSISPMTDVLLMTKKIMPEIEMSYSTGSIYDIDMDESGLLEEGQISLSVQNAVDIKKLYAEANDLSTDKENLNKLSISDINDWLQERIEDGKPIKVLVTRYPSSHLGSSAMLTVANLHSRRALAVMNYIDVKGRFEGDQDGDEVHVELLGDNSENDTITKAWVNMFEKANIGNINLDDFLQEGKKPYDLTNVVDRVKLIVAFSAGAKAIGEIANVQSVYSTLVQKVETLEFTIPDSTGDKKTVKIKLKQPEDMIKFDVATYKGKKGAWEGTVSDYLRIYLQAAVDNSKYNLLYEWGYSDEVLAESGMTGQRRLFSTLFEVAEDSDFSIGTDETLKKGDPITWEMFMSLDNMIKIIKINGRLRDGRNKEYKKLGTSDYLQTSLQQLEFIKDMEGFLNDLQITSLNKLLEESGINEQELAESLKKEHVPIKINLKDTKHKTSNGAPITVLEALVTAPGRIFEEMGHARDMNINAKDISPIKINETLHDNAHSAAMTAIETKQQSLLNEYVRQDNQDVENDAWIDSEIKKGEGYALAMGSRFYTIINNIKKIGIQTQDRHELLQDHIKEYWPMFKKLSNTAKFAATTYFMTRFLNLAGTKGVDRGNYTPNAPSVLPAISKNPAEASLLDFRFFEKDYFPVYNKFANENRLKPLILTRNTKFNKLSDVFKCR